MKRKLLSTFLALCMLLSLLPTAALAADEDPVAKIGDAGYASLQDAVNTANSGDTVTLLKDIVVTKADIEANDRLVKLYGGEDGYASNLVADTSLTIDLGGHTLRFAEDVKDTTCTDYRFFNVRYTDLTIQNGTFDLTTDTTSEGICSAICAFNGATVRLNVNFITHTKDQICFSNGSHVYIDGGTYTLTDDTYENYPYVGIGFYKTLLNTSAGTPFTINGGKFVNFDPLCQCKLAHYTTSGLGDGKAMLKDGGVFTVSDAAESQVTITKEVKCYKDWGANGTKERTYAYATEEAKLADNAVAKVGDAYYLTLAEAITAANVSTDKTITILKDCTYDWGNGSYESSKAPNGLIFVGKTGSETVTFQGYGSANPITNCTFKDLKIKDETKGDTEGSWEHGYLEFDTVTAENVVFLDPPQFNGTCALTKCTFTGKTATGTETFNSNPYSLTMYGAWVNSGNVTFTDCTFNGTRGLKVHEQYGSDVSSVLVDGCTFTTPDKPGVVIGCDAKDSTPDNTSIVIRSSTFTGCKAGDQDKYVYESDADVTTFSVFKVCGNTVDGVTQEHPWNDGVVTTQPTYDSTGVKTYTCTICGDTKTEDIAKLTHSSSGGGGGGASVTQYAITVAETQNGAVTADKKNAAKSAAVTLTVSPAQGYILETLTVTDKDGKEIDLTDKGNGKYTFQMPASKVTVAATFQKEAPAPSDFADVPAGSYYYDAVQWAAQKDITQGVDDTHFAPDASCTRAQIVTFLWRTAGSPASVAENNFVDVPADIYYAAAVAWAVDQGIVKGTSETTFSPDMTCTRSHAVTFLFRYAAAQGMDTATQQELVSGYLDAAQVPGYALPAFNWALANAIVQGADGILMPNDDCTRAQIVTLLYRLEK